MCRGSAELGGSRAGFTLLALLLVLAAMTLLVAMALQLGEDERRSASLVNHDARALAIAEVGVERTRAYVAALLATNVDLDLALDPQLDTDCKTLPTLDGNQDDDHLPVFTDGDEVEMPGSGKRFRRVPYADGAYLVRIDDNDDDGFSPSLDSATTNNPVNGCKEGDDLSKGKSNPVRDRDQTVILTVVGLYPGTDPATAQAHKVLRVRVGPQPTSGIIAGGTINMDGASHVCGAHGDIFSTGNIDGTGCMCGTGCKGGPPKKQACDANTTCLAQSAGDKCTAKGGGSDSQCVAGATVPSPPPVIVWNSQNAPGGCSGGVCTPFYYLRERNLSVQVFMWNYARAGCEKPQACPRIYHPDDVKTPTGCSASCWSSAPVYEGKTDCPSSPLEVYKDDGPSLSSPTAASTKWAACLSGGKKKPTAALVWSTTTTGISASRGTSGCNAPSPLYPGPLSDDRWTHETVFKGNFEYRGGVIPRGVWMVEGNVLFSTNTPVCSTDPLVRASVLAQGDMLVQSEVSLRPAHPLGITLLSGRDTDLKQGNTFIDTCGQSAAILVHEQFSMGANSHLTGQLVVENAGQCSPTAAGTAVDLKGNATIEVSQPPPITSGQPASVLDWAESFY